MDGRQISELIELNKSASSSFQEDNDSFGTPIGSEEQKNPPGVNQSVLLNITSSTFKHINFTKFEPNGDHPLIDVEGDFYEPNEFKFIAKKIFEPISVIGNNNNAYKNYYLNQDMIYSKNARQDVNAILRTRFTNLSHLNYLLKENSNKRYTRTKYNNIYSDDQKCNLFDKQYLSDLAEERYLLMSKEYFKK